MTNSTLATLDRGIRGRAIHRIRCGSVRLRSSVEVTLWACRDLAWPLAMAVQNEIAPAKRMTPAMRADADMCCSLQGAAGHEAGASLHPPLRMSGSVCDGWRSVWPLSQIEQLVRRNRHGG